ncbi:MAG: ribose-phosphate diphosphokinase [bacterium]
MPLFDGPPVLLTGNAHPALAQAISSSMEIGLSNIQVSRFPDGEIKVRIGENIRGRDAFFIQPTYATTRSAADNLMELLIMIDAARRASADRITAVVPYFGYARQDRKDRSRVPISAKLVADLMQIAGADRVLSLDLHSGQIQGFFNIPFDHLNGAKVLLPKVRSLKLNPVSIASADIGGGKLVQAWTHNIPESESVLMEKKRTGDRTVEIIRVIGNVKGRHVVIVDDEFSTCVTILAAIQAVLDRGALSVRVVGTHAKNVEGGLEKLACSEVAEVFVTDTLPLPELPGQKFKVCSVAPMLGKAIMSIHNSESLTRHFDLDVDNPRKVG